MAVDQAVIDRLAWEIGDAQATRTPPDMVIDADVLEEVLAEIAEHRAEVPE